MIVIREAKLEDQAAIVKLLKLSLGEGSSPKTLAYWNWKHEENPFGRSAVLLAELNGVIVGVRAFMRWKWNLGEKSFSALRAVDTATHPNHRGQGIFKKLTLKLVDDLTEKGDDFIFNTPNIQSKPGYLKMGWLELGRLPIQLKLRRPFRMLRNLWSQKNREDKNYNYTLFPIKKALENTGDLSAKSEKLNTPLSKEYLYWRYVDCPIQEYGGSSGLGFTFVFYVKEQKIGRELRISQLLFEENVDYNALNKSLKSIGDFYDVDYYSLAPNRSSNHWKLGFLPSIALGPSFTFRPLSSSAQPLGNLKNWTYDLGTLELF